MESRMKKNHLILCFINLILNRKYSSYYIIHCLVKGNLNSLDCRFCKSDFGFFITEEYRSIESTELDE